MNSDIAGLIIQLLLVAAAVATLVVVGRRGRGGADAPDGAAGDAPRSRLRGALDVITIAAWFGLATAGLQLLLAFVNRYVRGHILFASPDMLWMTPLAYVTIFAGLGIALAALVVFLPRVASLQGVSGGFAWLGVFALLLPFVQLHRFAAATLAAGAGVQVARAMSGDRARWLARMRTSGVAAAAMIAVLAIGHRVFLATREGMALRGLPAPRAGAPNVLLLIEDTVRPDNLSLYGYGRNTTPELMRWASSGTTFDLAFSTAPWTLKSHATLFTGLYPYELAGDFERPIRTPAPMLAEIFRDRGYVTGAFVANLYYMAHETGLSRGFIHYDDYRTALRQVIYHSWIAHTPLFTNVFASRSPGDLASALRHPSTRFDERRFNGTTYHWPRAGEITAAFLEWQAAAGGRPFFAFLNFFDAHRPYRPPEPFATRFAMVERRSMGNYDGAIANIDQAIGRMLDELKRRGVLDNTIVIISSDHGEQFGEHGLVEHGNSMYLPVLHVPLVIRYPARVPSNRRIATPVTMRDLAATILDLASLARETHVPGISLATRWAGSGDTRSGSAIVADLENTLHPKPMEPVRFGPMRAVFDGQLHYIRRGDGEEELFDYRADTAEVRNLAGTPDGQRELPRLRALLAAHKQP